MSDERMPDNANVAAALQTAAKFAGKPLCSLSHQALEVFAQAAYALFMETAVEKSRRKCTPRGAAGLRLVAENGELNAAGTRIIRARNAARAPRKTTTTGASA